MKHITELLCGKRPQNGHKYMPNYRQLNVASRNMHPGQDTLSTFVTLFKGDTQTKSA